MHPQLPAIYFRNVPPADLGQRSERDLAGAAQAHFDLARRWRRGHQLVRVYNPSIAEHGWNSPHSIVEIVTRDRPFLIDSLALALHRHGFTQHLVVHPILWVTRDAAGAIVAIADMANATGAAGRAEAWIHIEIDQERDSQRLQALRQDLEHTLDDVRAAVSDWTAMTARIEAEAVALPAAARGVAKAVVEQSTAFLRWLLDNNFTVLGVRAYRLIDDGGTPQLQAIPGSGLGILRRGGGRTHVSRSFAETPIDLRVHARPGEILTLAKSNSRSTVHRPDYFDYVGIKRYGDDGRITGELRLLGLYTSSAHLGSPRGIPIVRDRIAAVIHHANLLPQSHDGKALVHILETYPRQELFEASVRDLAATATGILHLQERQRVRLFLRHDAFGRYVACQVFVPRDLFDTARRRRIEQILLDALDGEHLEFTLKLAEGPLAQLYFVVHTRQRQRRRLKVTPLEARIAAAVRSWSTDLREALIAAHGEDQGLDYYRSYAEAFDTAYQERYDAGVAVADIAYVEAALAEDRIQTHIGSTGARQRDGFVFKLFSPGGFVEQSAILPILENMGVTVRLQRPYRIAPAGRREVWIHDHDCRVLVDVPPITNELQTVFEEAVAAAWYGAAENDGLNALVLRQKLAARDIAVLRTYARYLKQIGTPYGTDYVIETLVRHDAIACALFALFAVRFRLDRRGAARQEEELRRSIEARLEAVTSLDEDRILRLIYRLIGATCRTNYRQRDAAGAAKSYLSIKLLPELLPELPRPLPAFEIFVCSPRVEGVHLRGGPVARGGIRWSDRREDYRTEVLGLLRAQTVKNAVIVPVGAKGGFFVKRPPADPRARAVEGLDCYRTFIRGLLDLTDNLIDGCVVPPRDTVRHDGDDPYLVVAADKGTASFSDTANAIATEYGHWLGDAFASGGSAGYDHKKMGITARGAWESVLHAFQLQGRDLRREDCTVAGVGDMSGDVFGNGLLLSRRLKLIAAFNHQHILLDPNPDPAASFAERQRLFRLPGSTWDDYDRKCISRGGGVYPRALKSIRLSPQVRTALGTTVEAATPDELIKLVLTAPVDLLWNGGIGTYVKARQQRHEDVGDKGNDRVRVDAEDLRCKVVAEGGNLGFTQAGRIRYARRGGLINADWIDNSAGVDCSDHEVNIKILLQRAVARGALDEPGRLRLLRAMQNEVARHVLRNNYHQARAISHAQLQSEKYLDWYRHALSRLQEQLKFDRAREQLPADAILPRRAERGVGLYRPELATLLALAKIAHCREVIATDIPDDPYLEPLLFSYFPTAIRERFADDVRAHPLRREIVTTLLVNELVNRMGITFCHRLAVETGRGTAAIVRAYLAARGCIDLARVWQAIDALDLRVAFSCQSELVLTVRRVAERATRWLLAQDAVGTAIADTVSRYQPHCDQLRARFPLAARAREVAQRDTARRAAAGVPLALARDVARLDHLDRGFEIGQLALRTGKPFAEIAACAAASDDLLGVSLLRDVARALPSADVWQDRARNELIININAFHTAVTAAVLAAGGLRAWQAQHDDTLRRMRAVTAELDPQRETGLPQLLVLVSQLHGLAQRSEARCAP